MRKYRFVTPFPLRCTSTGIQARWYSSSVTYRVGRTLIRYGFIRPRP